MDYDWDLVILVSWPKRQNLLDLSEDTDYQAIFHLQKMGLVRSMLIAIDQSNQKNNGEEYLTLQKYSPSFDTLPIQLLPSTFHVERSKSKQRQSNSQQE